jgi:hypothetical protein
MLRQKGASTFLTLEKWEDSAVDYEEDAKTYLHKNGISGEESGGKGRKGYFISFLLLVFKDWTKKGPRTRSLKWMMCQIWKALVMCTFLFLFFLLFW